MKTLEDVLRAAGNPVDLLRNAQAGPNVYPGVPPEYTNWRDEQQAWQKACVLFNLSFHMADLYVEGPDATKLLSPLGDQHVQERLAGARQAVRAVQPRRPRHRRRHPVQLGAEQVHPGRAHPGVELDHVPRAGRQIRRQARARRALRGAQGSVRPQAYRFQIQGPNAMKTMEKVLGARAAGSEVLPRHHADHRRQEGDRAAPRHGRPARLRAGRPLRRGRRGARRDRQGGRGVRPATGRRPRLFVEHAGVGLDPLAAACGLLRREDEAVPPVAERRQLRSQGLDRRQLRVEEDRGLLPHALGHGLRQVRRFRARVHRPRSAARRWPRGRTARK